MWLCGKSSIYISGSLSRAQSAHGHVAQLPGADRKAERNETRDAGQRYQIVGEGDNTEVLQANTLLYATRTC